MKISVKNVQCPPNTWPHDNSRPCRARVHQRATWSADPPSTGEKGAVSERSRRRAVGHASTTGHSRPDTPRRRDRLRRSAVTRATSVSAQCALGPARALRSSTRFSVGVHRARAAVSRENIAPTVLWTTHTHTHTHTGRGPTTIVPSHETPLRVPPRPARPRQLPLHTSDDDGARSRRPLRRRSVVDVVVARVLAAESPFRRVVSGTAESLFDSFFFDFFFFFYFLFFAVFSDSISRHVRRRSRAPPAVRVVYRVPVKSGQCVPHRRRCWCRCWRRRRR